MKVLAVDPGLSFTGYAILENQYESTRLIIYDLIKLKQTHTAPRRMHDIYFKLFETIADNGITDLAFETAFTHKNPATFMKLSCLRGLLYLLSEIHGLRLHEFSPQTIKKTVTGHGHSDKEGVARIVHKLFPGMDTKTRSDVTDAVAIGICAVWNKNKHV